MSCSRRSAARCCRARAPRSRRPRTRTGPRARGCRPRARRAPDRDEPLAGARRAALCAARMVRRASRREVTVHEHSHIDLVEAKLLSGEADVALAHVPDRLAGTGVRPRRGADGGHRRARRPARARPTKRIAIHDLRDRRWVFPADHRRLLGVHRATVRGGRVLAESGRPLVRRRDARCARCLGPRVRPWFPSTPCPTTLAGSGPRARSADPPPDRRLRSVGERGASPRAFADCARRHGRPMPEHLTSPFAPTRRGATTSSGRPSRVVRR